MKKTIRQSFIVVLGIAVGIGAGYSLLNSYQFSVDFASRYIEDIRSDLALKDEGQGGPSPEELIFTEQGKREEFLENYKTTYRVNKLADGPNVVAQSYLVGDLETGDVIISKNANRTYPIASITKLMTAVVADELIGLSGEVNVSRKAVATYGRQGSLFAGEKYKVEEILYPLLLESSNDASEAIAESAGRTTFISNMNGKALSIGMENTYFDDPSGLSPGNTSSVSDLFDLVKYVNSFRTYIFDITRLKQYEFGEKNWLSNSKFRSYTDYYGGKNGYTDFALKTQVATFEMDFDGEKRLVTFIILHTDDIERDILELKDFVSRAVVLE